MLGLDRGGIHGQLRIGRDAFVPVLSGRALDAAAEADPAAVRIVGRVVRHGVYLGVAVFVVNGGVVASTGGRMWLCLWRDPTVVVEKGLVNCWIE